MFVYFFTDQITWLPLFYEKWINNLWFINIFIKATSEDNSCKEIGKLKIKLKIRLLLSSKLWISHDELFEISPIKIDTLARKNILLHNIQEDMAEASNLRKKIKN